MAMAYNNPLGGNPSDIGSQPLTEYWLRKAIEDRVGYDYFSQLSSVTEMPKHYGKKIIQTIHVPLLDDRNIGEEGINSAGVDYATDNTVTQNIYGSSRDIGTISSLLPRVGEMGGRVNRVSFTRLQVEGTFENYGFFWEYTKDAEQFDSESDLIQWNTRETYKAVAQIYEDTLQIDLINNAGTIMFGGDATALNQLTGEGGGVISTVTYDGLRSLSDKLDDLDVPDNTTIVKGSRLIDTVTIPNARYMYIGTPMKKTMEKITDYFNEKAFEPIERYADAGGMANGEWGRVGNFRIINVGKYMTYHAAAGALATAANAGYRHSVNTAGEDRYDAFPLLVVGGDSFTTISFKSGTGGKKFLYSDKRPQSLQSRDRQDPYGKVGWTVAEWYYGSLFSRPERIAVIWSVAEM